MSVLSVLIGIAALQACHAEVDLSRETIVRVTSYSGKFCTNELMGLSYMIHANECTSNAGGYTKVVCTKDGTLEDLHFGPGDDKCEGEPIKKQHIIDNSCTKTVQNGEKFWMKETLEGHCQGARFCDRGWKCPKDWVVADHEEGVHPECRPNKSRATRRNCARMFKGVWSWNRCNPPRVNGDECDGLWKRSHEGSRVERCMYPKATCSGCGFKGSGKMKCHGDCKMSKRVISYTDDTVDEASCNCRTICQGSIGWRLQRPNPKKLKTRKAASCYCFFEGDLESWVIQKNFERAGEEFTAISSSDENGRIDIQE